MTGPQPSLYRPHDGWFGDVMPLYSGGTHHLYYAFLHKDDLGAPGVLKGLDWAHVTTRDFVAFTDQPLAIRHGGPDDPDLLVGAGSVVADGNGGYVAFYAGINPALGASGRPEQIVLRATSRDLVSWVKDPDFALAADPRWYERDDWRDPFVFRIGRTWQMLLCARVPDGPFDRRGCIGLATSDDLVHWTVRPPLHAPGTTRAPECPEIFELGGDTYLLFSTYSDRFASRYRIGPSPEGPWRRPATDALESNDVYAMNTATDGTRRYAIGWLATRAGDQDSGHRQWGGDLIVHELARREDGTLGTHPVADAAGQFPVTAADPQPRAGQWQLNGQKARFDGSGFGWCSLGHVGENGYLDVTVDLAEPAEETGIAIRATSDFGAAYLLRLEPRQGRVVFDRRPHRIDVPFDADTDRSYVSAPDYEIERPLRTTDGTVRIQVFVTGSAISAYVADVALTTRGYDLAGGEFGIYAANGSASFSNLAVSRPQPTADE
jgi:beta-fructofuranosidase